MTWPAHRTKWHDQHIKWHDMTCHVATNHSSSPHVTSQPSTLLHLTPQATSWHQNRSHDHHGTAEGSFTAKKWFGHRAGRSPCARSIGKFFFWLIVLFFETSAPGLSGYYWYLLGFSPWNWDKYYPRFICVTSFSKEWREPGGQFGGDSLTNHHHLRFSQPAEVWEPKMVASCLSQGSFEQ